MTSFDSWSLSEEQLLRLGRDALWLERYRDACEALSEYCERLKRYDRPISAAILAYYGLSLGHSRSVREGLRICLEALLQDHRNPNIYLCVGRLYILAKDRKAAIEVIQQGLRVSSGHRGLIALRESLGIRQPPPISFLPRGNAVNVKLGKAMSKIKGKRKAKTA